MVNLMDREYGFSRLHVPCSRLGKRTQAWAKHFATQRGILHHDLKPGNIAVFGRHTVK